MPGPLTAIALSIRAGARCDGRHPGIAHMAEHMLFQGTSSLDQLALNRRAAELGGEHNADTGYETISLTFEVFNEDVPDALALLADQFYRSEVNDQRFRKERRVVLDEIRGRIDDPVERLHAKTWGRFFRGPLAQPVWGSMKSLREMTAADVQGYIRRHFTHARSVLAVAGGISRAAARKAITHEFRHGSPGTSPGVPRRQLGQPGVVHVHDDGGQAYLLHLMAVPADPRMMVAVGLALDLVGADPDSRLFQEVRERLGLGYDVSTSLDWGADWAVATVSASAARSAADRLQRAVLDVCHRAAKEGFAAEELQRARKKLRYRYASLAESRIDRALALAEGTLLGFPLPEDTQRLVGAMPQAEIEAAWRRVVHGHSVTGLLR